MAGKQAKVPKFRKVSDSLFDMGLLFCPWFTFGFRQAV